MAKKRKIRRRKVCSKAKASFLSVSAERGYIKIRRNNCIEDKNKRFANDIKALLRLR